MRVYDVNGSSSLLKAEHTNTYDRGIYQGSSYSGDSYEFLYNAEKLVTGIKQSGANNNLIEYTINPPMVGQTVNVYK